jgi:hypothetical protein
MICRRLAAAVVAAGGVAQPNTHLKKIKEVDHGAEQGRSQKKKCRGLNKSPTVT